MRLQSKIFLFVCLPLFSCGQSTTNNPSSGSFTVTKTDAQWKDQLGSNAYHILREKGTERAFTGEYWDHKEKGTYVCRGCHAELFKSETKFKSGTGWPSFYQPAKDENIGKVPDYRWGMESTEVICSQCGGHLGHVFDDGPAPTYKRYCINSASLDFVPVDAILEEGDE